VKLILKVDKTKMSPMKMSKSRSAKKSRRSINKKQMSPMKMSKSRSAKKSRRSGKKIDLHNFFTATQINSLKKEAKKVMNGSLSLTKFKTLVRKIVSLKLKSRSFRLKGGEGFFSNILSFFGFETEKKERRKLTPEEQAEFDEWNRNEEEEWNREVLKNERMAAAYNRR
jgi:hypothetical protein